MVWSHLEHNKSCLGGWWWQTKFSVSPGPGLLSRSRSRSGPEWDLSGTWPGSDLDLTWDLTWDLDWDLDLSLTIWIVLWWEQFWIEIEYIHVYLVSRIKELFIFNVVPSLKSYGSLIIKTVAIIINFHCMMKVSWTMNKKCRNSSSRRATILVNSCEA